MSYQETIIRQLEDYILAERNLHLIGSLPFQHQGKEERGYPYIRALNSSLHNALDFIRGDEAVRSKPRGKSINELRFLEVGCGIGTKCELARQFGLQAYGIDLLREYIELARKVFPDCCFEQANALEYDYSGFDVVYYHTPFFEDYLLQELEQRVLSQMPSGAILIATRISAALAANLNQPDQAGSSYRVKRIPVEIDVGRLILVAKL